VIISRGGLTLERVGGAPLVSLDVEESPVGLEEGAEAGAGQSDFLEDHGRGDLLPSGEDLGELGLDFFIGDLREAATGALAVRGGFCGLGAFGGETKAGEQGIHLLELLGVLLVNGGDLLGDLLLDYGLGLENLLGGFLLKGGELLDEVKG